MNSRIIHLASAVHPEGSVSAACFKFPRAIDMAKATWTTTWPAVTCPACRKVMHSRSKEKQ